MNLFAKSLLLQQALAQGLINIVDICGKGSWKGMTMLLHNNTLVTRLSLAIPEGTVFQEKSGKYQQMMLATPATAHVPARVTVEVDLPQAICTQPSMPAPPPRFQPIPAALRDFAMLSDEEFGQRTRMLTGSGQLTDTQAAEAAEEHRRLRQDQALMDTLRRGQSELRFNFSYVMRDASAMSPRQLGDALLGMATNFWAFDEPVRAAASLSAATQRASAAPESQSGLYTDLATVLSTRPPKELGSFILRAAGSGDPLTTIAHDRALMVVDQGFADVFGSLPGADKVLTSYHEPSGGIGHQGAALVIQTAFALGPALVAGFEVTFKPADSNMPSFIDMSVKGQPDLAIEVKSGAISDKDVINQLRRRLERDSGLGRCLVVVPDGAAEETRRLLTKAIADWSRSFPQEYGILVRAWNEGRFAVTDVQGVRPVVLKRRGPQGGDGARQGVVRDDDTSNAKFR